MIPFNSPPDTNTAESHDTRQLEQFPVETTPPVGSASPQILVQGAVAGKRHAAWRLLHWLIENEPHAMTAVASCEDDRLARYLLEFIAMRRWAGKPISVPISLRTPQARTQLRALFLSREGPRIDQVRVKRTLVLAARDKYPAIQEEAIRILGLLADTTTEPVLLEALHDETSTVRIQAVKALTHIGSPSTIHALRDALHDPDKQVGSQVFCALVQLGYVGIVKQLLRWGLDGDSRAGDVLALLDDDRPLHYLLEFIVMGTWAGKAILLEPAHTRAHLQILFLSSMGINAARAERVLLSAAQHDKRPAVRGEALHLLGLLLQEHQSQHMNRSNPVIWTR